MSHSPRLVALAAAILAGHLACADNDPRDLPGLVIAAYDVPDDYATIQAAVDSAQPGDTITVGAGTFFGSVDMKPGVHLVGLGPARSVIAGQLRLGAASGCSVEGFLVTRLSASGLTSNVGISGSPAGQVIRDNTIQAFDVAISFSGPGAAIISDNIITNSNQAGIRLSDVGAVRVSNNQIRLNKRVGVEVLGQGQAEILHNTFVGNGFSGGVGGAAIHAERPGAARIQNNVITGNLAGMNVLDGPNPGHHHNLVWGNTIDYANAATVGAGDVAADPRFVDAAQKDFRLLAASPAIDAGAASAIDRDADGLLRPAGLAPDLGAFEYQPPAASGELVLTEVMANPMDEASGEYLELHNPSDGPIDAAGLVIDDGDSSDPVVPWVVGGTTLVPAGGWALVLDRDHPLATSPYRIAETTVLLTVPNATLGSGLATSDAIVVRRAQSVISTWLSPFDPADGLSVERIDPAAPDARPNWVASPCRFSPGRENCASAPPPAPARPTLSITEVMANPVEQSTGELVELYNGGSAPAELVGLVLTDGDSSDVLVTRSGSPSLLPPGHYGLIVDPDLADLAVPYGLPPQTVIVTTPPSALGNALSQDDPVTLYDSDGLTVLSTYSHPLSASQRSIERKGPLAPDSADAWVVSPCPAGHSAALPNCAAAPAAPPPPPRLLINEIMANPEDEDRDELVEIFNPGTTAVDMAGLVISDGFSGDVLRAFSAGGPTLLPPGGYAVVLDPEYLGRYAIPPAAIRLRPENSTIGNGIAVTDPITLYAPDGMTVIARFSFPFNPGNGISVERIGDSGDVQSNWGASTCASGSSPGARNCLAPALPNPTPRLAISEVMANPLDEGAGEFVELVNLGAAPLDVGGFLFSDGDAVDLLEGFQGGATVIPPGARALVVDRDHVVGSYPISSGVVLLTTPDKTLGSGLAVDDALTILEGAEVVATYLHPFDPGNGTAAERVAIDAPDEAANWIASPCPAKSSPGAPNCAAAAETPSGIVVVDVNSATSAELQQVGGIGPATATRIIDYRSAHGPFDAIEQLTALEGMTPANLQKLQVVEGGEDPFVIGVAGGKTVKVFHDVPALLDSLPLASGTAVGPWIGALVRVERAVVLDDDDATANILVRVGNWGYEGGFEPEGDDQLRVVFGKAPGSASYARAQTDVVNAMADWSEADGDPYLVPSFYRWTASVAAGGVLAYAHVFTLQGVLEVAGGDWQLRVRARADAGVDRVVMIERWLPAESWQELDIIWAYEFKPVIVIATNGLTYGLPYRLAQAHPARSWWYETRGELLPLPRCTGYWECEADDGSWPRFTTALGAWRASL